MTFEVVTLRTGFCVRTPEGFREFFEVALEDVADSLDQGKFDGLEVTQFLEGAMRLYPLSSRFLRLSTGNASSTFVPAEGLVPEDWFPVFACDKETPLEVGDIARLFKENPGAFEVSSQGARFRALTLDSLEAVPRSLTATYLSKHDTDTLKANLACKVMASSLTDLVSFSYTSENAGLGIANISRTNACCGCFAGLGILKEYTLKRRYFECSKLRRTLSRGLNSD